MEGYRMGAQAVADFRDDQMRGEMGAAAKANAVTESASGDAALKNFQENYVPQEGGPATAAEYLQQNPDILKSMSPDRKASFSVGGESFDNSAAAQARMGVLNTQAMAGVLDKSGRPEEAMRLRQQARVGDLTELQIKGAQRGERTAQIDEDYNASRAKLGEQFSGNKMRVENEALAAKYEQDNAAYQNALKQNPANPAAAGLAPQKPALRVMAGLDMLHDANLLMQHDMSFGKVDPSKALQYQQLVGQVKKEVGTDAFKLLHTGDIQGAIKAFESQGDLKIPEGGKVEARKGVYEVAGQKIPTNELVVRLPNGNTQVINGLQGMDALDAADKIIGNNFKGAQLGMEKQRLGVESAGLGLRKNADARAQAEFDAGTPGRKLQSTVDTLRMGLADATTSDEKSAIAAKLQAIQSGLGPDKSAPSEVKLAAALVRAGVVKTEAEGLKYALHSKDYSPEKIRADIYNSALKTGYNDTKKANEVANQAMKDLGYDTGGSAGAAKPTTKAEFDKLPSGATFIDPDDGKTYRKK